MFNRKSCVRAAIVAFGLCLAASAPAVAAGRHGGGHPRGGHGGGHPHGGVGHMHGGSHAGIHGGGHGGRVVIDRFHRGPRFVGRGVGGVYRHGVYVADGAYPVSYGGYGPGCRTTRSVAFLPSGLRRITTTKVCIVP